MSVEVVDQETSKANVKVSSRKLATVKYVVNNEQRDRLKRLTNTLYVAVIITVLLVPNIITRINQSQDGVLQTVLYLNFFYELTEFDSAHPEELGNPLYFRLFGKWIYFIPMIFIFYQIRNFKKELEEREYLNLSQVTNNRLNIILYLTVIQTVILGFYYLVFINPQPSATGTIPEVTQVSSSLIPIAPILIFVLIFIYRLVLEKLFVDTSEEAIIGV